MKRTIEFSFHEGTYFLEEEGSQIFAIDASDLKFNSLEFYRGVYKGKSSNIELVNRIDADPYKKGNYIFLWLSDIVSAIREEFAEGDAEEATNEDASEESTLPKIIPLYELAACAGDGIFTDNNITHSDIQDATGMADFAVTVVGNSMEPTIHDHSVVYIKKKDEAEHKEIGLFVVDGEVMCKRYIKQGRGYKLVPENSEYKEILGKEISSITYLGKVLLV